MTKRLAAIARDTGCAVVVVHHSRKLGGQAVDAEASRGASALTNGTRTVLGLNRMEKGEAVRFGISEAERHLFLRVSSEKANRAPAGQSDWFRLKSVNLGNGGPLGGDEVAAVERWTPPNPALEAFAFDDAGRAAVQAKIASGEWRESKSAGDWAGKAVADVIGADLATAEGSARVKAFLRDMIAKGQLRVERRPDASRHIRPFVVVGARIESDCDSYDL